MTRVMCSPWKRTFTLAPLVFFTMFSSYCCLLQWEQSILMLVPSLMLFSYLMLVF